MTRSSIIRVRATLLACALALPLSLGAQAPSRPADFRWEKTLPAGSRVSLHNIAGDIDVSPSATGKVEVVGIKRGSSRYADAVTLEVVETSRGIVVCAINKEADQICDESGLDQRSDRRRRWRDEDWDDARIDIVVRLPKAMEVSASAVSGDVTVAGAEGRVRVGSVSGDVRLTAASASSVRASSVSGDVDVRVEAFSGEGDLHFTSVSGNVTADLPRTIDADVSMRSVSGSLDSEFPLTLNGRMSRHNLEARIGRGGRLLEVHTVSGNVRLRSVK